MDWSQISSFAGDWSWFPKYLPALVHGLWETNVLLVLSCFFGGIMAVPIGLVQVTGPKPLGLLARGFCSVIRGTPLLVQIWLLYYGVGSLFPLVPWIRESFVWPVLREGFFYAVLAFTLSFAGYEGAIMRGAFLGVPKGELEAARAIGMSPFLVLRRVWLPRAFRIVLPTLGGEIISQLKSTPLAFTITIMDLFGASNMIRQNTYRVYEPLFLVAVVYFAEVFVLTRIFNYVENLVPQKR